MSSIEESSDLLYRTFPKTLYWVIKIYIPLAITTVLALITLALIIEMEFPGSLSAWLKTHQINLHILIIHSFISMVIFPVAYRKISISSLFGLFIFGLTTATIPLYCLLITYIVYNHPTGFRLLIVILWAGYIMTFLVILMSNLLLSWISGYQKRMSA